MIHKKVWMQQKLVKLITIICAKLCILDHSQGFGGKFGVQKDRVDQSAVGFEHKEDLAKHESQKGKKHTVILTLKECKKLSLQR